MRTTTREVDFKGPAGNLEVRRLPLRQCTLHHYNSFRVMYCRAGVSHAPGNARVFFRASGRGGPRSGEHERVSVKRGGARPASGTPGSASTDSRYALLTEETGLVSRVE